jgi:RHS repeat-associated protein
VGQITFANGAVQRMTTTKQYDYLNRLTQIASQSSAPIPPVSFNYNYNAANQRSTNLLVDGSYWVYQYDSLGQVTSGHKHFRDNTPVPGQEFDYSFDTIGNRTQTQAGGDQKGANQRVAGYSANNLNQITSRQYPGAADVIGAALATNAVTVNGQTAWRKGEYFWSTINLFNSGSAQWQTPTVVSANFNTSGGIYAPSTPEQFNYDMDGNLTADGRWNYTWDAENRLTSMTVNTGAGPQYQLSFVYDAKGRRIQKNVAELNGSGSAYVIQATTNFLYDGWNLIAMLNPQSLVLNSFVWGSDLSGSTQGAGGVGGLLEVGYSGSAQTNCFVAFDGNGNVAALINAADGTVAANYEYGPFGEVIRATGPMARINPFRFSTKYQDDESDLLYYGHRYYKASTGTWVTEDPLEELGFLIQHNDVLDRDDVRAGDNLYLFCDNHSTLGWDYLGLLTASGGDPSRGILEHNSYLTFTVTCPYLSKAVFDSVDYSGAVPALEKLFGESRVDSLAGPIPPAGGLGGFRGYGGSGPVCGGATQIQVYMRTRFASLTFGSAAGAAAYSGGTTISYHCEACCAPGYTPGPGNPVLPNK